MTTTAYFKCGHARTNENTYRTGKQGRYPQCVICKRAAMRRSAEKKRPKLYLGQRFGMLVVTEIHPGRGRADVRCDCGAEKTVWTGNLMKGTTASCGCTQGTHKFPVQRCLLAEVWRWR